MRNSDHGTTYTYTATQRHGHLGNYLTEMCIGSESGSYLRPIDSCITQLKAQGLFRTCAESKEEEGLGSRDGGVVHDVVE